MGLEETVLPQAFKAAGLPVPSHKNLEIILRFSILITLFLLAFSVRLFSVLRYESVIHEFDPCVSPPRSPTHAPSPFTCVAYLRARSRN